MPFQFDSLSVIFSSLAFSHRMHIGFQRKTPVLGLISQTGHRRSCKYVRIGLRFPYPYGYLHYPCGQATLESPKHS